MCHPDRHVLRIEFGPNTCPLCRNTTFLFRGVEERRSDRGRTPERRAQSRQQPTRDRRREGIFRLRGSGSCSVVRRHRLCSCASPPHPPSSSHASDAVLTTRSLASRSAVEKRPTSGRATAGVGTFLPGESRPPSSSGRETSRTRAAALTLLSRGVRVSRSVFVRPSGRVAARGPSTAPLRCRRPGTSRGLRSKWRSRGSRLSRASSTAT